MSTFGGNWGIDRPTGPWRGVPADAQARAAELAARLAGMLAEGNPQGPHETARLLVEVPRLPAGAHESFLAAATGAPAGGAREWAEVVRERIARAYPESSERRRELGQALVSLEGRDAGALATSVLEARVAAALATLGDLPQPARLGAVTPAAGQSPPIDTMETPRRGGLFCGPVRLPGSAPDPSAPALLSAPTYTVGDFLGASSAGALTGPTAALTGPTAAFASEAGSPTGGLVAITQEELSLLGTGLTARPPQGFWNIGAVGAGIDPAIFDSEEYCRCPSDAINRLVGDATAVRPIGGDELVAAIRDMGVPLERVDPNQVNAALGFINEGASGAVEEFGRGAPRTVDEQRERLALALRQFRYLAENGPPPMDRATAIGVMWSAARIPGHAFEGMSDAEVLATAQQVASVCNTPGRHELKVGSHTVELTIGEGNSVLGTSTRAPSAWSRIGNIARVALTAASFIPGPVGLVARGVQAGLTLVNTIRHGGGVLDILQAGASFVGSGAAGVGRLARAGSNAARIASNVARVAQPISGAVRGVQGIGRGGLSGVVTGAAGVAQGFSGALRGAGASASSPLVSIADDVGRALHRVGAGLGAADGYIHANRAVSDAKEALERARATGDAAEIRRAEERLAEAERAKRSAVLGGLAAAGQIAGDALSFESDGQSEPRAGEVPTGGRSGFQVGAEIFSRGMNMARGLNEDDLLRAGTEAIGGLAAARQGTDPLREERVIGPDSLPIVLRDENGNPLIDELGRRLYLTTNDFDLTNEASSVLDGLAEWRDAARVENQARDAVEGAEQALALARSSGNPEAIAEAEANLRATRQGLVRAELDRTLAQDAAAERFTGAVGTFENSHAADEYRADQERQFERVAASLHHAHDLATDLAQVVDDPRFSMANRQLAAELRAALAILEQDYTRAVASARDDPRRLAEINEEYADLLTKFDEEIPRLLVARLGVSDTEPQSYTNQGSGAPTRPRGVVSDVDFEYPQWLQEALEEARKKRIDAGLPPWETPPSEADEQPQGPIDAAMGTANDIQRNKEAALEAAAEIAGGAKALSEAGLEIGYDPVNNVVILASGKTFTGHEANRYLAALALATPVAMIIGGKIVQRLSSVGRIRGRYPINSRYAGEVFPLEKLSPELRLKYPNSVRFTPDGFPDFSPYAVKTVKIQFTPGNRYADSRAANAAAGFVSTPSGYTWHHVEDGTSMLLVPADLHEFIRHTGGVATTK